MYVREAMDEEHRRALAEGRRVAFHDVKPNARGLVWENAVLPFHIGSIDVFFGPGYTIPLSYRGKSVVAIHSVAEFTPGAHPWWYDYTYARLYTRSSRHADRVIVPCETTKRDVEQHYGIAEHKIDVVPQGADDSFRPLRNDQELLRRTRLRWLGDDVPYVLFVGKLSQRRNILALIEAFAAVKKRRKLPHRLLLFGPNHLGLPLAEFAASLGVADDVVQTDGRIDSHEDLVPVYNGADVYVNPSIYEGWSITTVEALACGTAVIVADRGGLRDVVEGHALPSPTPPLTLSPMLSSRC